MEASLCTLYQYIVCKKKETYHLRNSKRNLMKKWQVLTMSALHWSQSESKERKFRNTENELPEKYPR
jgi:hypothetical protein